MSDRVAVLDHGSDTIKAGHVHSNISAEADLPPLVTPTSVRVPDAGSRATNGSTGNGTSGESEDVGGFKECRPIQRGNIVNWDQMEALWHYIFYEQLGWEKGNEGSVLVAEKVFSTSKQQREIMTQIFFEKFNVSGLHIADQPRLALSSFGKPSGCVVDVGHGSISVSCVTEGQVQLSSCGQLPFGGEDFSRLVAGKDAGISGSQARSIKHEFMRVCESPQEYEQESRTHQAREHILPDGSKITLTSAPLECGEAIFNPSLWGHSCLGLGDAVYTSIMSVTEPHLRRPVSEGILICGGGSQVQGLEQRLVKELNAALPPLFQPSVLKKPDYIPHTCPSYSTWVGGFIEAKLVFNHNVYVSKYDYDECGPSVISKKVYI